MVSECFIPGRPTYRTLEHVTVGRRGDASHKFASIGTALLDFANDLGGRCSIVQHPERSARGCHGRELSESRDSPAAQLYQTRLSSRGRAWGARMRATVTHRLRPSRLLRAGIDCSWSPSGLVAARSCFWWISGVSVSHGVDAGGSRLRPAGLCLWLITLGHPLLSIHLLAH